MAALVCFFMYMKSSVFIIAVGHGISLVQVLILCLIDLAQDISNIYDIPLREISIGNDYSYYSVILLDN